MSNPPRIDAALMASEGRLRTLIDTLPDLIWLKDPDGLYLACNPAFERFFGAKESQIVGRTDHDFVGDELADFFRDHDREAIAAGGPKCNEEWITLADDGRRVLLQTTKTPIYDAVGRLIGVLGIGHDITERKATEDALRRSEACYRQLFECADGLLSVYDRDGVCRLMNRKVAHLFGGEPEDFVGKRFQSLHDEFGDEYADRVRRAIDTGRTTEYEDEVSFPTGKRWLISRIHCVAGTDGAEPLAQIFSTDVTERRQAEATLQAQLDELRRWHDVVLGREERILALKQEVNTLLAELGRAPRYASTRAEAAQGGLDHD
ncbi:PAS domain-containing protein [Thiocystis violacea]|uniref:PAS domain-containing protein n=1 Tax=Thiocystis violacea TaxID=13725 RepID=UPI001F5C016E|nr:PAS domain-containing protein [Thiocystis violacea]